MGALRTKPKIISALEIKSTKKNWVKFAQEPMVEELYESMCDCDLSTLEKRKVSGPYKRLSLFLDKGIWRVGFMSREITVYTGPEAAYSLFIKSKYTRLVMEQAHEKEHVHMKESRKAC